MMIMSERSEDDTNGIKSSKVIVRENSEVNSSSRIYYYGRASVPFLWETRPGTPKDSLYSESLRLPPLTPPPSYYSSSSSSSSSLGSKKSKAVTKQTRFVKSLLSRHVSRSSFSWSSTSSSSSSSFSSSSSPSKAENHRPSKWYLSCSRLYVKEDDEEEIIRSSSPKSTLWYKGRFSSSMGSMKRALCSVLSHGSNRKDLRLM